MKVCSMRSAVLPANVGMAISSILPMCWIPRLVQPAFTPGFSKSTAAPPADGQPNTANPTRHTLRRRLGIRVTLASGAALPVILADHKPPPRTAAVEAVLRAAWQRGTPRAHLAG